MPTPRTAVRAAVWVISRSATAHTASATSVTALRAQEGTTARQHAQGMAWRHAPTTYDYDYLATSATRPSVPYYGQTVYESDTDTITARSATGAWQTVVPLGAWPAWTPTLTNLTLGNGTQSAVYHRVGRRITFRWKFTLGSTSTVGTSPQFTLPVTAHADYAINMPIGSATLLDAGVQAWTGWPIMISTTTVVVTGISVSGTYATNVSVSATIPFTWGTGDVLMAIGTYEAAT